MRDIFNSLSNPTDIAYFTYYCQSSINRWSEKFNFCNVSTAGWVRFTRNSSNYNSFSNTTIELHLDYIDNCKFYDFVELNNGEITCNDSDPNTTNCIVGTHRLVYYKP